MDSLAHPLPAASRAGGGQRVLVGHPRRGIGAAVRRVLAGMGVRYVDVAADAGGLLAAVEAEPPDLVIIDRALLRADSGLIETLRAVVGRNELPVLVLGRFASMAERRALMAAGATDLIIRPLTGAELAARLRGHLENRLLNRSLQEVIRSLQTFHTGAVQRMQLARDMQLGLLPDDGLRTGIERRYGVRLDSHFESSSELGGDIWGARPLDDDRFAVFLCDFTGHGVAAALNTFRLHALLEKIDLPGDDPAEMLGAINRLLVGLLPESQFAAMLYAVVDTAADRLTYATAGAPKPIIGVPDCPLRVGESVGLPLGVSMKASYRNRSVEFPPGAFLFLFSDALFEARDWEGRPFGYPGILDLVRQCGPQGNGAPGAGALAGLLDRYFAVMPRPLADDLTALWLTRGTPPPTALLGSG
ncbi:PP2C family protein-serine/threonine phosphatase [Azospirillum canadense]|uniref:PP2C family protein-serine/threonine phosphatase n=1 Tax=Azospirillum canadense TaxID=403962 RepID=UPI0022278733|nr:SpoIIE family protein phosphatase [Azospirillum canadense]MCW2237117.1 sigma-B regulation protein RsbU (phosphoserine phosphatase) [Azospirillum canadense]